jgi:peptidoglycan/LPS O-acetylase OafA/YrhL
MGLLRLLLALGVVTEHAGDTYFIGSYTAVQIFLLSAAFTWS